MLTITPKAWEKVASLCDHEAFFRITILGGGCSGFQYQFTIDTDSQIGDTSFENDGYRIVIDSVSLELCQGGVLDYHEDLAKSSFVLKNPLATASCGCGKSFSPI